uniref:NADH-ubiquinone oxidoreductase chain 3 n=1 Tax=Brachidontes exustus TaxID=40254 RepID=A0A0U1V5X2_BRAEX|nr:NADH dehydrogenase subunit 3 [Brachidontes exustus]AIM58709.1 NADH dehydrogenase subunit 3 [Brachidontes exustus]
MLFVSVVFVFIICMLLSVLFVCLSFYKVYDREKSSPYECGFESMMSARHPFAVRFFLVAAIFVVFDVEIALLIPVIYSVFFYSFSLMTMVIALVFVVLLFVGLFHEHREGSLDWVA